jgi:glutathione S-transferase
MTYTLITANRNYSSWSLRPWVLMKTLGIAFEDRIEPFTKPQNYDEFRAFSPTGQVPCLIHDGLTVWDSLGITLYLADRHKTIWPQDEAARAWAMCAVAEMHGGFSALRERYTMNVGVRVRAKPVSAAAAGDVARIAELWEEGLTRFGGPFLCGERFCAADAFYAPVVYRVRTYGLDIGPLARVWLETMLAHPAMRQWETEALAESWREESHEEDLANCGDIIVDYRTA